MSDELERLSQLLDELAAERDPRARATLTPEELDLAETAALLKASATRLSTPDDAFVDRLAAKIAASAPSAPLPSTKSAPPAFAMPRRRLLGRLAAAAAGIVAGGGAGAAVAYGQGRRDGSREEAGEAFTTPMVPDDRGQWLATGVRASTIQPGAAVRVRSGALEGFLINPGNGGAIFALSAACTHMGCLISWLDGPNTFLCPCHGAQYNANGTVLSGIARHPLPRLRLRVDEDGQIYLWGVEEYPANTSLAPYSRY